MREQTQMMIEWRKELMMIEEEQIYTLNALMVDRTDLELSDEGVRTMRKQIHDFGFNEVFEALQISIDQYYNGSRYSLNNVVKKVGGICYNRRNQRRANE